VQQEPSRGQPAPSTAVLLELVVGERGRVGLGVGRLDRAVVGVGIGSVGQVWRESESGQTGPARCRNRKIFLFLVAQTLSAAQSDSTTENGFIFGGPTRQNCQK
jgi:hypothetical protein